MTHSQAELCRVQSPLGTVFAVHPLGTNAFWTERTEAAAIELARERGFQVVGERDLSREEFLRLTGRQPAEAEVTAPDPPPAAAPVQQAGVMSVSEWSPAGTLAFDSANPDPTAPIVARYFLEGEPQAADDGILIVRPAAPPPSGIFCSDPCAGENPRPAHE